MFFRNKVQHIIIANTNLNSCYTPIYEIKELQILQVETEEENPCLAYYYESSHAVNYSQSAKNLRKTRKEQQ